ncbi:MAG: hypothetical protein UZ13_00876 [Chloroflexi bacterium OLB13]|nr:MAG: hypothetical protein UZ13_00876 [Chloroflexi bacterium OLB13]
MNAGSLALPRAVRPLGALISAGVIGAAAAMLPPPVLAYTIVTGIAVLALLLAAPAAVFALLILSPLSALLSVRLPSVLPADLGQLLLAGALGALVAAALIRRRADLPRLNNPMLLGLLGFVIAGGISAFSAASLSVWLVEWLKWLLMAAVAAWVIAYRRWQWVLFAVTVAGAPTRLSGFGSTLAEAERNTS